MHLRYCCTKHHSSKVFQLVTMDDQNAHFSHQALFADKPEVVLVPHKDLKLWKVTRAKQPLLCDKQIAKAGMPSHNPMLLQEFQKHQVNLALHNAYLANTISEDQIAFATNPASCYTLQAFKKKGQLKLVPVGNATKAKDGSKPKLAIQFGGQCWAIGSYTQDSKFNQKGSLIPFWWVQKTAEEEDCNMVWSNVVQDGIKIPILTNSIPLDKHVQLLVMKDGHEDDQEDHKDQEKPAKKKAKKV